VGGAGVIFFPGAAGDAVVVVVGVGDGGAGVVPGLVVSGVAVAGCVGMLGFTKGVLPNLPGFLCLATR
jgi:hypothetical protein